MKFKVPFYKQEDKNDCGPVALQMVLEYFGKTYSRKELIDLVNSDKSGATWTLGIAKAAAELGFETEFYTTCLGINPSNYNLNFYKKEVDEKSFSEKKLERLKVESQELGVKMTEKSLKLDELLGKISEDCIPIILLDWNIIKDKKGYQGHFVPVVGYDEKNIYVHNQGENNPGKFIAIKKNIFEKARKAKGTDEDIVYIHKR